MTLGIHAGDASYNAFGDQYGVGGTFRAFDFDPLANRALGFANCGQARRDDSATASSPDIRSCGWRPSSVVASGSDRC